MYSITVRQTDNGLWYYFKCITGNTSKTDTSGEWPSVRLIEAQLFKIKMKYYFKRTIPIIPELLRVHTDIMES